MDNIRCPCLLIRGRDDWIVSDEMVDATGGRLVNARALEVIKPEGVGHFPHCEQPLEVADAVATFLKQNGLI
jgi:pimeloyl-ACP methyl ester carboxylesterase